MIQRTISLLWWSLCLATSIQATNVHAQLLDPYARVSDPRAIMRLNNQDNGPLHYRAAVGWPAERDTDNYFILAKDEGHSGIVTHIWTQLEHQVDSLTWIKLYIDDSLILTTHLYDFFKHGIGALRPPFDSSVSGAMVSDVQMPYRRNFKISYYADWSTCCLFWAIAWRNLADSNLVESFRLQESPALAACHTAAEHALWNHGSPWLSEHSQSYSIQKRLNPGDTLEVLSMDGPALVNTLRILPDTRDSISLRDTWIEMNWDGSPYPSVSVPLPDMFGCGVGPRTVNAFEIKADTTLGYTSFLPMPFYDHGEIRIINRSSIPIAFSTEAWFTHEPIDRNSEGYFSAQFNESNPTRYHILYPVGSVLGKGRFIGMHLMLPWDIDPYYLEGDPVFEIDSDNAYQIRYTGSEDYFNGGWFFEDGAYSLPFSGCTYRWNSDYRFHYMDAIDFEKSFDFKMQHGTRNDYKAWYRSVSFFYSHWTPFWVNRDTIRPGENWEIAGSGYDAGESIVVRLDSTTIVESTATDRGSFTTRLVVPQSWKRGIHSISVNDELRPTPVYVLDGPSVEFLRDSVPAATHWKDTLLVVGRGFAFGEQVLLNVDTARTHLRSEIKVDSSYGFKAVLEIPWLPDGHYHINAVGNMGNAATSDSALYVTRSLNYECENLLPPLIAQPSIARPDYMGYFDGFWSEEYYFLIQPDVGQIVELPFTVPVSDTFQITWFGTYSPRSGRYNISIDAELCTAFDGFAPRPTYNDPIRSGPIDLGVHFLSHGQHSITFACTGKDSSEALLGADNFVLTPTTPFRQLPDSALRVDSGQLSSFGPDAITIWPNPATTDEMHIGLDLSNVALAKGAHLNVTIFDLLGRSVLVVFDNELGKSKYILEALPYGVPNGNYFCVFRYTDSNGSRTFTRGLELLR